ncbi:D-alanyl-lipoteichoic acid biosynthesis protein DltB, partial [Oscillospiraceae bacterium OttesenSCG-928-F05]|nr:D-alanyl-lipoteichoic acid biosynthesis protein DltB [Oscillospiraceae bacterium OttesenSCG-928-F05]
MVPYDGLFFFYCLLLILIPAVVIGLLGFRLKWYGMLATVVMLLLIFDTAEQRLTLLCFYLFQVALIFGYRAIRARWDRRPLLWLFVLLAIAPLALVKIGGLLPGGSFIHLLGISYMTFRAVQVLIETYDGLIKDLKFADFSYFLLFFPALSSGPVDRYRR